MPDSSSPPPHTCILSDLGSEAWLLLLLKMDDGALPNPDDVLGVDHRGIWCSQATPKFGGR